MAPQLDLHPPESYVEDFTEEEERRAQTGGPKARAPEGSFPTLPLSIARNLCQGASPGLLADSEFLGSLQVLGRNLCRRPAHRTRQIRDWTIADSPRALCQSLG